MQPQDIDLNDGAMSLLNTFGSREVEREMAYFVRVLALRGKSWEPITQAEWDAYALLSNDWMLTRIGLRHEERQPFYTFEAVREGHLFVDTAGCLSAPDNTLSTLDMKWNKLRADRTTSTPQVQDLRHTAPVVPQPAMHPAIAHLMQFFAYEHLPPHLRAVSLPFCELAKDMAQRLPDNPEKAVTLRKLLEAKDAAMRTLVAIPAPTTAEKGMPGASG